MKRFVKTETMACYVDFVSEVYAETEEEAEQKFDGGYGVLLEENIGDGIEHSSGETNIEQEDPDPVPDTPTLIPWEKLPKLTVWVATITHKHGEDMSVHRTNAGAIKEVADFARQYWEEVAEEWGDEDPDKLDDLNVIDKYFDSAGETEFYAIEEVGVKP